MIVTETYNELRNILVSMDEADDGLEYQNLVLKG